MRLRVFRVAIAAAVAVLVGAGLPSLAAGPSRGSCSASTLPTGFSRLTPPDFGPDEPTAISAYLVARHRGNLILATNGATVMDTTDAGCHWRRAFSTEWRSPTGAKTPAGAIDALLALPNGTLAAVVNPVEVSISADVPAASLDYLTPGLVVSTDGGMSWAWRGSGVPPTVRRLMAVATPDSASAPGQLYAIAVDARSDSVVLVSNDAGQHWTVVNDAGSPGRGQDIAMLAAGPGPRQVWVSGHTLSASTDGGKTFVAVPGAPTGITTLAFHGSSVAVVSEFGLYLRTSGSTWRRLSGTETGTVVAATYDASGRLWATATRASGGALYEVAPSGRMLETVGPLKGITLDGVQPTARPGIVVFRSVRAGRQYQLATFNLDGFKPKHTTKFHAPTGPVFDRACYGDTHPPQPPTWSPAWTPLPPDEAWMYITDFHDGGTFRLDRFGGATQVAQTPGTPEGTALDPFGRVIIATRFSRELLRMDPITCTAEVIDPDLPNNESPTFDAAGNLFAVDTNGAKVWEYPWPQRPYAHRLLVHDFRADSDAKSVLGMEDVRVAPAGSPYAGDVFAQVFRSSITAVGAAEGGQTGVLTIVRLHRDKNGAWHRSEFWTAPESVSAAGFAFLPSGDLLVPDITGSSQILRISADGRSSSVFAVAATSFAGKALSRQLAKIDVTPSGMVYVSAPEASGRYCPAGKYSDLGGDAAIFRFDALGHEVDPPFTGVPFCPLGISVPHLFPQLPKSVVPLWPPKHTTTASHVAAALTPVAIAYAGAPPAPPPAQPISQPQAQTQPNPNPQSQSQSQGQTNPNAGFAVGLQSEERPQLALQENDELRMSRPSNSRHGGTRTGLFLMSALTMTAGATAVALRRRRGPEVVRVTSRDA